MALFDVFKKKKDSGSTPADPTVILSSPKKYTITFRDYPTGRSLTDDFPEDMELNTIANRLKEEGILSFPLDYLVLPGVPYINTYGTPVKSITDLHSGMTVELKARSVFLLEDKSQNVYKAYPLTFYLMVDNVCSKRIDYIGYGFENPENLMNRMKRENVLSFMYQYSILYWPDDRGEVRTTVPVYAPHRPVPLCVVDPDPSRVMIIQQHPYQPPLPSMQPDMPTPPMYGCPSAATPEQISALGDKRVDILHFD